jgi:tRNA1Val (adenine37-N6)-methyltransferase
MPEAAATDETTDVLCRDRLRIIQKKDGYRFSIDALLLANFLALKKHERVLDIGTGCGIIPLYLAMRGNRNEMTGVEIQQELYETALKNRLLGGYDNITFINDDVLAYSRHVGKMTFEVILSNPPYTKPRTGRISPGQSRCLARHESDLNLDSLLKVASSLLVTKGRLYVIYPARRLAEVIDGGRTYRLEPKRLRFVHPRPGERANLFLTELMKNGGEELTVEPPLYIYEKGVYTEEVQDYYSERKGLWKAS